MRNFRNNLSLIVLVAVFGIFSVACTTDQTLKRIGSGADGSKNLVNNARAFNMFRTVPSSQPGYRASIHSSNDSGFKVTIDRSRQDKAWGIQVLGSEDVSLNPRKEYIVEFEYTSTSPFNLGFSVHPDGQTQPDYLIGEYEVPIVATSREWKKVSVSVRAEKTFDAADHVFHFKIGMAREGTEFSLRDLKVREKR